MRKIIDLDLNPPIRTWTYHAFRLSVLSKTLHFEPWVLSNFIQMCSRDLGEFASEPSDVYEAYLDVPYGYNFLCPEKFYDAAGLVQHSIDRALFNDVGPPLVDFIRKSLDHGFCVYAYVDYYNTLREGRVAVTPSKSNHGAMVCGYDTLEDAFLLVGYETGKYGLSWVSRAIYEKAFQGTCLQSMGRSHQTVWLMGRENIPYRFDIDRVAVQLEDYVSSSNRLGWGSLIAQTPSSLYFGIETYEMGLVRHLEVVSNRPECLYHHLFHVFLEHKLLMLERMRYLSKMGIVEKSIVESYSWIRKQAQNLWLVMLKFGVRPKSSTLTRTMSRLRELSEKEGEVLSRVISGIRGG